ncbi:MAG: WG repeat-containing protein [Clostridia bacterium]
MKKIVISVLALLLLTGCSNNSSDQTLFVVNKKDQYGLIDIDGNKKTRFIYDRYEPMAKDGYIVVKDDKYGYLSYEGEEIIKLGKYQKLESISNMIVAYDKDDNISILSSLGEVLYKTDDKTEIVLSGLPIIHQGKKYLVLYDTGKVLVEGKSEILNANIIKDGYMAVAYEDNIKIYNQENLNREVKVKTGGKFQLMSQSEDNGYLFYDREGQKALFCDEKGKLFLM